MRAVSISLLALAALAAAVWGFVAEPGRSPGAANSRPAVELAEESDGVAIRPIPQEHGQDERIVALGRHLFHDARLSRDGTVACVTCHDLENGGDDGHPRSRGIDGKLAPVNTPTVLNSGFNFTQFWDGRARSLEEQLEGADHLPHELGSSWPEVIRKIGADPEYAKAFAGLFRDGATPRNVSVAIATFERSLITPNARFDGYLLGYVGELTDVEKAGYKKFRSLGCVSCHQGVNVGGNMFQVFGVIGDYFGDRGNVTEADLGRYAVTKDELDRHVFRVPSLRNVAETAPYFHDGSAETLEEAVRIMGRYQLGQPLSDKDISQIVAFLKTLTGEIEVARP